MERTAKKNFIIDVFYLVLIILLVIFFSYIVLKYLLPFVIGAVIAFTVQKPALFLSRKIRVTRGGLAAVLSASLYLTAGAVFIFLIYRIVVFAVGLTEFLPHLFSKMETVTDKLQIKFSDIFTFLSEKFNLSFNTLIENTSQKLLTVVGNWVSNTVSAVAKKMPSFFISSIVTLVATCYIAKDFPQLLKFAKTLIGKGRTQRIVKIKNIMLGSVFKLVKGYLILSLITFFELYIGFLLLKIDYALSLAVIIALVDLLPVIGTGTVMVPWAVSLALIGDYSKSLSIGILFVIIVIVRNFSEPKIIGMQIGVNSLFTLLAMFLGLRLLGIAGLILFPIIFIVVIRYYKDEMNEGLSV